MSIWNFNETKKTETQQQQEKNKQWKLFFPARRLNWHWPSDSYSFSHSTKERWSLRTTINGSSIFPWSPPSDWPFSWASRKPPAELPLWTWYFWVLTPWARDLWLASCQASTRLMKSSTPSESPAPSCLAWLFTRQQPRKISQCNLLI